MYSLSAAYYDKLYGFKDYQAEAEKAASILFSRSKVASSSPKSLLDIACGTGKHLAILKQYFAVEGLDTSADMLVVARQRYPDLRFHQADMTAFDLGRRFAALTCLFSSIGYAKTVTRLKQAARCMAHHLEPGGVLIIEPWFTPSSWKPGTVHALLVDEPELKIARVSTSLAKEKLSIMDMHYLVGTPEGTEHFVEHHEMGLFEVEEIHSALEAAGLRVDYDPQGLTGRGLWIAEKPEGQVWSMNG